MPYEKFTNLFGMDKGKRIREARQSIGVSQEQFAKAIGVKKATVSHWETGRTKDIKNAHFEKIVELTMYNAKWLATGEGPRTRKEGGRGSLEDEELLDKIKRLPPGQRAIIQAVVDDYHGKPDQVDKASNQSDRTG